MRKINLIGKLGIGLFALVDDEDFEYLNQFKWYNDGKGYAIRRIYIGNQESRSRSMSRDIMDNPKNMYVDHINMYKLDNRRSNLRLATNQQNQMNRGNPINNTSGHKGVSWDKQRKLWQAHIKFNGKQRNLGRYEKLTDASQAYNNAALELHGSFARINT